MRYPFDKYRIGTRYGVLGSYWRCGWHSGVDFTSVAVGGDGIVYPILSGTVVKVAKNKSYGNYVIVSHAGGYLSLYAHLKAVYVRKDAFVRENTAIGSEGATGNATGRHLHLEVHKGAYKYPAGINPLKFIAAGLEVDAEVKKDITIRLNGVEKIVTVIEKEGNNYVRLQDLRDERIVVGFDAAAKVPVIQVVR